MHYIHKKLFLAQKSLHNSHKNKLVSEKNRKPEDSYTPGTGVI
jgi:hypothetical protein